MSSTAKLNWAAMALANDNAQQRMNLMCGIATPTIGRIRQARHVGDVLELLSEFTDCAGYSGNRRSSKVLDLSDESGVQDLIYFMLRPSIDDLVPETPISGAIRQYSIQDFRSKSLRMVVEAKRVRDKKHGKSIKTELHDDIGEYKNDPFCDDLIFFVYDPDTHIESSKGLIASIEGTHAHNGRKLTVHCIVQR